MTAPSRSCRNIPSRSPSRPGQRPLVQQLRVSAAGQRLRRLPASPRERSAPLLQPHLPHGLVPFEQGPGGIDLLDMLGAGEHQPALQLPPDSANGATSRRHGMVAPRRVGTILRARSGRRRRSSVRPRSTARAQSSASPGVAVWMAGGKPGRCQDAGSAAGAQRPTSVTMTSKQPGERGAATVATRWSHSGP